jgi:hypothetical protein
MLVVAAEMDVLCKPAVLRDAAERYRAAFSHCLRLGMLADLKDQNVDRTDAAHQKWDGVAFEVVNGVGHHLQNHVEWEKGAEVVLKWAETL